MKYVIQNLLCQILEKQDHFGSFSLCTLKQSPDVFCLSFLKHLDKKFLLDSNILASPEAGGGNCLSCV